MPVSSVYPPNYNIHIDKSYLCWPIEYENIVAVVSDFVGADCWGLAICRQNGEIIPLMNTYALIEELGYSLGKTRKYCKQYEDEREYRTSVIDNAYVLINNLKCLDTILIYMYGENGYVIRATRYYVPVLNTNLYSDNWLFNVYASSEYIQKHGGPIITIPKHISLLSTQDTSPVIIQENTMQQSQKSDQEISNNDNIMRFDMV